MKYNVKIETTLQSLLETKSEYENQFEVTVSDEDVKIVFDYLTLGRLEGLVELFYNMGIECSCYLCFHPTYDIEHNHYTVEVMFDGAYFGFELLIETDTITVFNGLDYGHA